MCPHLPSVVLQNILRDLLSVDGRLDTKVECQLCKAYSAPFQGCCLRDRDLDAMVHDAQLCFGSNIKTPLQTTPKPLHRTTTVLFYLYGTSECGATSNQR